MAAYNRVNGGSMTEHRHLQKEVLRGEWGFDGFIVSDWLAARSTTGDILGGLDVAMPGPKTVYGDALATAVRAGDVEESLVDDAVRNVLRLAARVGALDNAPAVVAESALPAPSTATRWPARSRAAPSSSYATRYATGTPPCRSTRPGPARSRSAAPPPVTPGSSAAAPPPSSRRMSSHRSTASPPPCPTAPSPTASAPTPATNSPSPRRGSSCARSAAPPTDGSWAPSTFPPA